MNKSVLIHEAGHLLACHLLGVDVKEIKVTDRDGHVTCTNPSGRIVAATIQVAGFVAGLLMDAHLKDSQLKGNLDSLRKLGFDVANDTVFTRLVKKVAKWMKRHLETLKTLVEKLERYFSVFAGVTTITASEFAKIGLFS